jgi:hypothetical protein
MRKLLYWIIPLIGVAYTLWMMIIMFKGMPHPARADRAEYMGWAIECLIGMTLFWLMPMLGIWFIAWVVRPKERLEVLVQAFYVERPMKHQDQHCNADGNVVPFRRELYFRLQQRQGQR